MSFADGASFLYVKPNYQLKAVRIVRELSHLAKLHKPQKFHCLSASNLLQNTMETFTPFTKSATRKPLRDSGIGTSLAVQWLGLRASAAGGTGLILGEGPKILQAVRLFQEEKINRPKPIFLPGESHEQKSLEGYSPWGHGESDTTESLTHTHKPIEWKLYVEGVSKYHPSLNQKPVDAGRKERQRGIGEKEVYASPLLQIKVSLRNKVLI